MAAEEFCVFGDWGGSLNKPEKPERSGGFFANGAPYALLATFVERAIWRATCIACQICLTKKFSQFVRQNAPACHITLIERFFFIEKSSLGFWTIWVFLPYYLYERVLRKFFRQRWNKNTPRVLSIIMRRKIFWRNWNKTGVPCHYNITEGFQK